MIVVTGGKAGVGATTVAVNLAAVLADRGERVLAIDAAEHRNDLAELAGLGRESNFLLSDVISGNCGVADAIVQGPVGMQVLAARGRVSPRRGIESRRNSSPSADFSRGAPQRLLAELETLRGAVDLIVVDAGNGLTAWTRRFWQRAQLVVLVATTSDAALLATYAAIKLSSADGIRPPMRMLVNQSASEGEADDAHRRVDLACSRFLSRSIEALPALPLNVDGGSAGAHRAPRVWEIPNSSFGRAALWVGRAVSDALAATIADRGCTGPGLDCKPRRLQPVSCIL